MKIFAAPLLAILLAGCAAHPHMAAATAPPAEGSMNPAAEADLYLGIVDGLIKQKRYDAAIAFLDQYAVTRPASARYELLRGDALLGAARYDEAVAAFTLAAKSGLTAQAYDGIGRTEAARAHWQEASTDFRYSAARSPTNAEYLNNLGYAELQQRQAGDVAMAVADLRKAYELEPGSTLIRNNLILATAMTDKAEMAALLETIADPKERAAVASFAAQWVSGQNPDAQPNAQKRQDVKAGPAALYIDARGLGTLARNDAVPSSEKAVP